MTTDNVQLNDPTVEDLSLEFISSGPIAVPRLGGAKLLVDFARISQNTERLKRTLENYWEYKSGRTLFRTGTEGKEHFDSIEIIVYRRPPPPVEGKAFLPVSQDAEAEMRIINIAVGMNYEGVSLRDIKVAFLPNKELPQIIELGVSLEETLNGEVALFEDKKRPELSVLVNLSVVTRSPRVKDKTLSNTLINFWRVRRSDYPIWTKLGPIYVDEVQSDIERCLAFHLRAQYWRSKEGSTELKLKAKKYVDQLLSELYSNIDLITILNPSNSNIVWACGWESAAELAGISLPDRTDSEQLLEFAKKYATGDDLEKLGTWILAQFRTEAAEYIKANRDSTIDLTIQQFRELVESEYLIDDSNSKTPVFEDAEPDEVGLQFADLNSQNDEEINPFGN